VRVVGRWFVATLQATMQDAAEGGSQNDSKTLRVINRFERALVLVLIALLMLVVAISTAELDWLLVSGLSTLHEILLDSEIIQCAFSWRLPPPAAWQPRERALV
jgi:uncharacterized membrane protein YjgN (DUF898 family)